MINNLKHNYIKIDYKNILDAYSHGIFPMAENIDSLDVFWVKPKTVSYTHLTLPTKA